MQKDTVEVLVVQQGDAVCGKQGYMLKKSENIAAFYLDGWGKTGRIYALTSCDTSWIDGKIVKIPSLCIENGEEDSEVTEICFPEYEGWNVSIPEIVYKNQQSKQASLLVLMEKIHDKLIEAR